MKIRYLATEEETEIEEYEEYLTDEECDRYAVEVQNGDGYYDTCGNFRRYQDDSWWS